MNDLGWKGSNVKFDPLVNLLGQEKVASEFRRGRLWIRPWRSRDRSLRIGHYQTKKVSCKRREPSRRGTRTQSSDNGL